LEKQTFEAEAKAMQYLAPKVAYAVLSADLANLSVGEFVEKCLAFRRSQARSKGRQDARRSAGDYTKGS
jgi:hypothetical protein